jgi:hypothetical protein
MADKKYLRQKLIQIYGQDEGVVRLKKALIIAAKSRDSLEDVVVKMTRGRLRRKKDLEDEVGATRQNRGKRGSVFSINTGLPSLGKKR